MTPKPKLREGMNLAEFDNGYWYALELKAFAKRLGIPAAGRLRKDELEAAIKSFIRTGRVGEATRKKASKSKMKDVERGLRLKLPVVLYTNDAETKDFLERESLKQSPEMKRRSGARYRLNRWREEQIARGVKITYADLVREYVRLNRAETPFDQVPHGRYINFVSDYFKNEQDATRAEISKAWKQLKSLDIPKNYASWKSWRARNRKAKK